MANNKDFVVNGPVVVGKDTKVTVGSISAGTVDLSTGNYFTDSPSGDYTYTFANPGDVQSFQIEATGGSAAVAQTFSTTLYTGTGAAQDIDNGLDLAGDGGMTWIKSRTSTTTAFIFDTERGATKSVTPSDSNSQETDVNTLTAFNSNGFTLGSSAKVNSSSNNYVSWSFKKKAKFFDIVNYSGTSAVQNISHNLGSVPGMIIVKCTNTAKNWGVYHRSAGSTDYLQLNTTAEANTNSGFWNNTDPTSTQFTLGTQSNVNGNGNTYVAYLFAHDTASDGLIQCGSYTGNGAATGVLQDLGWQPQWIMVKVSSSTDGWILLDSVRGVTGGNDPRLEANTSGSEANGQIMEFSSTGFTPLTADGKINGSGKTYIYMAIRSASAPAITWPTNIEWTAGSTPSTPAEGETDVYTFTTDDGGTTYTGIQSIDNAS